MTTKKNVLSALLASMAIILGVVEMMLPSPLDFMVGAKLGLSNIVSLVALYLLGSRPTILIVLLRVLLVALLIGTMSSLYYSLAGALLSFLVMLTIKKLGRKKVSIMGVSVMGAVFHHVGQLAVASLFSRTWLTFNYLPLLSLAGIVTGLITGLIAHLLIQHLTSLQGNLDQNLF